MRQGHIAVLLFSALLGTGSVLACAEATDPLPPPEEVLLLVHSTGNLSLVHVNTPTAVTTIPLGGTGATPTTLSALDGKAVVPLGDDPSLAVVDLRLGLVERLIPLPPNSGATGAAIVDDSIAYVANPNLNSVTQVNFLTGDTASVAVGRTPRAVVFTRGRVFVINANLTGAGNPAGPSWVTVIDPETNRPATGVDSIPLPGPGNARYADVGPDGVLYVMNAGPDDGATDSRLSLVDPVGREELGNFAGFGNAAGAISDNGGSRLFLSSATQGLMIFDLLNRKVLRGAGNGIPIADNTGVSVDKAGRIYAVESGDCTPGSTGRLHILRRNLTESRVVNLAECPVTALVTEIPPQ